MGVERVVAVVRQRRGLAILSALLVLVLAGAVVALVGGEDTTSTPAVGKALVGSGSGVPSSAPAAAEAGGSAAVTMDTRAASAAPTAAAARRGALDSQGAPAPSMVVGAPSDAKVVKTATMRVEVGKGRFESAFERASTIAAGYGGYVSASKQAAVDDKAAEGTVTIRVPADKFEAARRELAGLGKVEHQEQGGDDVTAQLVDYDARIRSLQGQEQAFTVLLSRARTVGEVLEVQNQLFNVRQQIEQLQAQRANLDNQASLSTISVTIFEPGAALTTQPEPEPATGLARSWERAWDGAIAVIGGTVIVIGYLVPLTVLALLGFAGWRLATRRRRGGAAPAVTPAS